MHKIVLAAGASLTLLAAMPAAASTYTFGIQYFTIAGTYGSGGGDPDFNTIGCCTPVYTDEVLSTLGPNGLPVYNTASSAPLIHDVNSNGEITWWSPSFNSNVTATGSGTVTSPYQNYSLYPPNGGGSNDANGFQGLIISGDFTLASDSQVTFTLGADDDAFLYVDNTIVTQEGGIHGVSAAPSSTPTLLAGTHNFKLFYVDRNVTGAGLNFSLDTQGLIVTPPTSSVPEPATWAMMVGGFGLIGGAMRRRARTGRTAPC